MLETVDLARPRRAVFSRLSLALIAAAGASCAAAPEAPAPVAATPVTAASANAATADQGEELAPVRPQIYAPFRLTADLSALSAEERRMLGLFIDAAQIMDGLFWQQAYGDRDRLLGGLEDPRHAPFRRDQLRSVGSARREPAVRAGRRREAARRAVLSAGHEPGGVRAGARSPGKDGLYTFITRDPAGKLALLPYDWRFARELQQAASMLARGRGARARAGAAQLPRAARRCAHAATTTARATWPGST